MTEPTHEPLRTPVQVAAKRVYEALEDVDRLLFDLDRIANHPNELNGVQSRLEALYSKIGLLMHDDDSE